MGVKRLDWIEGEKANRCCSVETTAATAPVRRFPKAVSRICYICCVTAQRLFFGKNVLWTSFGIVDGNEGPKAVSRVAMSEKLPFTEI